jgi:hypothetical protein
MAQTPEEIKAKKIARKRVQITKKEAQISKYEAKRTAKQAVQLGYVIALQTETIPKKIASLTKKNIAAENMIMKYNSTLQTLENQRVVLNQELAALLGPF